MEDRNAEKTFRLDDLLYYVLGHARALVICALVGALVIGGGLTLRKQASLNAQAASGGSTASSSSFTEARTQQLDSNAEALADAYLRMADLQAFMDGSIYMGLDSTDVCGVRLLYVVQTPNETAPDADGIVAAIGQYVAGSEVTQAVADALGVSQAEAQSLVQTSDPSAADTATASTTSTTVTISEDEGEVGTAYVLVTVYGTDEASCDAAAQAVASALDGEVPGLEGADYTLSVMSKTATRGYDNDLRLEQVNVYNDYNNASAIAYNILSRTSNSVEKTYVTNRAEEIYLAAGGDESADLSIDDGAEGAEGAEPAAATAPEPARVGAKAILKYVIAGLVAGLLAACAWLFAKYLASSKMVAPYELEDDYGVTSYFVTKDAAVLPWATRKRLANSHIFDADELCNAIEADLCAQGEGTKVCIVGSRLAEDGRELAEALRERLVTAGLDASTFAYSYKAADDLRRLHEADAIVWVETADASSRRTIAQEAKLLAQNKVATTALAIIQV